MNFLIDAQLPPALAAWLREQGHEAQHVQDLGLRQAEDQEIWMSTLKIGSVLITKDEDFAERAARIVWLRIGNTTPEGMDSQNTALVEWLTPRFPNIVALLERGDVLVEVR